MYSHCNRLEPEEMMSEARICLDMEKKMGLTTWIVGGEALIARAYLLSDDPVHSEEVLINAEERMIKLGKISNMFTMNPYIARLQLEVLKLDEMKSKNENAPDMVRFKSVLKKAHKSSKLVLGQFRALQELKPEGYRLTGTLFWLEGKKSGAVENWKKSIEAASTMPKKQELGRTYMEVGKRLLERNSLTKSFDNMDGRQYLKKAEEIFKDMNLKKDLAELEIIRTEAYETIS
jgi:CRISPR/Cas system CMR-associated protein Cmr5 small subunit